MPTAGEPDSLEFDDFHLNVRLRLLYRNSVQIDLPPKVVETLTALIENNGRVVDKDRLMQIVWPGTIVDESNVFQNLYLLRKTLGLKEDGSPYIETLRGRGYRFTANVRRAAELDLAPAAGASTPGPGKDRQFSNGALVLSTAVLTCVLVTAVAAVFYRPWGGVLVGAGVVRQLPDSIAVLPFRTIGVAPSQERLGQGLCDALITRLANVPQLGVRPTAAVRQYVDPNQDPVEIGRMQGVDAVLDGRIQGEGDRVRVTVQLIDTLSGATMWSSQLDASDGNALDIQDRISSQVFAEMMRDLPRRK